jgi:GMP synthase-like glutamine amidotransferase
MSKALGGEVTRAPVKEIGWGEVSVTEPAQGARWFGPGRLALPVFQWHGETFSVPSGAQLLLSNGWCTNQAFAMGPHLALQCHIEMTEELVRSWCETGAREIARSQSPAVQSVDAILDQVGEKVRALHEVADTVYARWTVNLRG